MDPLPLTDVLAPHRSALAKAPATKPVRLCFAAAHVVMRESYRTLGHSLAQPGAADIIAEHVDWAATLGIRRHLVSQGLGIAEAMDTAQRFFLGWPGAERLIRDCGQLRPATGWVAGAGTDHLAAVRRHSDLVDGVVFQARLIQSCGGMPMLLPMPWLSQNGASERDYVDVYTAIVRQLDGPLFVHWLGDMFLPALRGYFPGDSFQQVLALDPGKVRGCKLSLLDAALELRVRRELLPRDQIVLSGDDFHFGRLLLGGDPHGAAAAPPVQRWTMIGAHEVALGDFSHALLGILDAIAVPAGIALALLARGDSSAFLAIMDRCERLGRHVFGKPTQHYKAGLAFVACLDGLQANAMLVNREDLARDRAHYQATAELAAACGALRDLRQANARLAAFAGGPP